MTETLQLLGQLEELLAENAWLRGALLPSRWPRFRGLEDLGLGLVVILEALLQADCPVPGDVLRRRVAIAKGRRTDLTPSAMFSSLDRLRPQLRSLTPPIAISHARGRGYFLDELNRSRLAARRVLPATPHHGE